MSLCQIELSPEFQRLTEEIYNRQMKEDSKLQGELSEQAKRKMYQDVAYNLSHLYTALVLDDGTIFECHARWIYQLLCPLMSYCTIERVRDLMLSHYTLMEEYVGQILEGEERIKGRGFIGRAKRVTVEEYELLKNGTDISVKKASNYAVEQARYFDCLLKTDTRGAVALVSEYIKQGIPLEDVYVEIVGASVRAVGTLWQQNRLSVDREHYCTSTSQYALSQLYPMIYQQKRRHAKLLAACVGSELHEFGARMVSDLFEYDGWDSIYLGAAVPKEAVLAAIKEHHPLLVLLSVTMPLHLILCRETVEQIRSSFPEVKIAVGGKAFENTDEIWRRWSVDVFAQDARELVRMADDTLLR